MNEHAEIITDAEYKRQCQNVLVRLRRRLRVLCGDREKLSTLRQTLKQTLDNEIAKTFKNQYMIADLQAEISVLDDDRKEIDSLLNDVGGLLFELLPLYEKAGASDHDFAQLINCNIKKMEQLRAYFNERDGQGHSFFVDAVFICHAEQPIEREKEPFVIYSDLPFFDAMTHHFMETIRTNPKMEKAVDDTLDEFFPELRAHQYIATEGENGELTLKKYYPPLKLI